MENQKMTKHGVVTAENVPITDSKDTTKKAGRPVTGDDQFSQLIDSRRAPCPQNEDQKPK